MWNMFIFAMQILHFILWKWNDIYRTYHISFCPQLYIVHNVNLYMCNMIYITLHVSVLPTRTYHMSLYTCQMSYLLIISFHTIKLISYYIVPTIVGFHINIDCYNISYFITHKIGTICDSIHVKYWNTISSVISCISFLHHTFYYEWNI